MNRTVSILIVSLLAAVVGTARENKAEKASASVQEAQFQPDARDLALLNRMLGTYNAELTVNMTDGKSMSASGSCSVESLNDPELLGARGSIALKMANGYPYREYDLFGFHGGDHRLHLLSITCEPVAHDHVITVKDQDNFSFIWRGTEDGKPATEEITARWISPNELRMDGVDKVDGNKVAESVFLLKRTDQAMQGR